MYTELLRILTCQTLNESELEQLSAEIKRETSENMESLDLDEESATSLALMTAIGSDLAVSDKIDEFHELLLEQFEENLIKPFPYDLDGASKPTVDQYFKWLDPQLKALVKEHGGYELILFQPGLDDSLCGLVVYSKDVDQILKISENLSLRFDRTI